MTATVTRHRKPAPVPATKPQARLSIKEMVANVRKLDKASEPAADRMLAVQTTTKAQPFQAERLAPSKNAKAKAALAPKTSEASKRQKQRRLLQRRPRQSINRTPVAARSRSAC
ncbi:MAG: hypothetical protein ACR652_10795 [Methylocystis sp.]|uniref:hypothetical protein n=1 Tax=Methylocystis sp. TaxID=1911079 RepID=UPI003DA340FD